MKSLLLLFAVVAVMGCSGLDNDSQLTKQEQEFVASTVVVWQPENNYEPFVSVDNNNVPHGLSVDFLALISQKTGLRLVASDYRCQLTECLSMVGEGKVDLLTSVRATPDRSKYLRFTRPYYFVGTTMISRVKNPQVVGVGKGSAVIEYLKLNRPDLVINQYDSDELAMANLLSGQVDAIIVDKLSSQFLKKRYHYNFDERDVPHDFPISFATADHHTLLISILNKGISQITGDELRELDNKWK